MNDAEARAILSVYRPGESGIEDARFEQAKRYAKSHPEMAQWWAEQQELDDLIALKLVSTPVPSDLKTRLTAWEQRSLRRTTWSRAALLLAASIVAAAVMFSSWRGPFQPAVSLAQYREEMVSIVKVAPTFELESTDLAQLQDFLAKADAPARLNIPAKLKNLGPIGCRVLRFRGHDVSLICFKRAEDKLVHLFIIDAAAVAHSNAPTNPEFAPAGEWMTATWTEGKHTYLMTTKGDRALLERYVNTS